MDGSEFYDEVINRIEVMDEILDGNNNGDIDVVKCQNFKVREATQSIYMESVGMIGLTGSSHQKDSEGESSEVSTKEESTLTS